jgi:hypothetical protein
MSDPIVYGFPRSTFVNIVRLILTHKETPYSVSGSFGTGPPTGRFRGRDVRPAYALYRRYPCLGSADVTFEGSAPGLRLRSKRCHLFREDS